MLASMTKGDNGFECEKRCSISSDRPLFASLTTAVGVLLTDALSGGKVWMDSHSKGAQPGMQMKREGEPEWEAGYLGAWSWLSRMLRTPHLQVVVDCPIDTCFLLLDEPQNSPDTSAILKSSAPHPCSQQA